MTKHENILADIDISDIIESDASATTVADLEQEQAAERVKKADVEPFDIFGDYSFSGEQTFTADMVPATIFNYATDMARRPGLNAAPIAIACLVTSATAIRDGWRIQPKLHDPDWIEKPVLWVGLPGGTGAKKTFAQSAGIMPLRKFEEVLFKNADKEMKDYRRQKAIHNEEMKFWRKEYQAAKKAGLKEMVQELQENKPEEPVKPEFKRFATTDVTIESLMKLCKANPDGIILDMDELTGWLESFDLYSGGSGGRDRAKYLSGYNSAREVKDRAGDDNGPLVVDNFAVNILGGIQDGVIAAKFRKDTRDGFLARFLFAKAEVHPGIDEPPRIEHVRPYMDLIGKLVGMAPDKASKEKPKPGLVKMSPAAAKIRENIEDIAVSLHDHPSIAPALSDHLNKWPGIFSRLCLIFHMIEGVTDGFTPDEVEVTGKTAQRVYDVLTKYFLPEAGRIYYDVMQAGGDDQQNARRIAGHILAKGKDRITVHEIGEAFSDLKLKTNEGVEWNLKKATGALEIMGWITADKKKDGTLYSKGDFAKMKWRVNGKVHELFSDHADAEKKRREIIRAKFEKGTEAMRKIKAGK